MVGLRLELAAEFIVIRMQDHIAASTGTISHANLLTIGRQQETRGMFLRQRIVRHRIHRRGGLPLSGDTKK